MILAELEIFHTRPIAPTRRVALGERTLPVEPPPGFGGLLLGGIVAAHIEEVNPDLLGELSRLIGDLEVGRRIPQPRLRHRFQTDRIGLTSSRHRLVGNGDHLDFEFEEKGRPESQILGAVYAAGHVGWGSRTVVMDTVRRAIRWRGPVGPSLVAHLSGARGARAWSAEAFADPEAWALGVLGLSNGRVPDRSVVLARFRVLVRDAHPDHGGASAQAAQRILDLTEARRILLSG